MRSASSDDEDDTANKFEFSHFFYVLCAFFVGFVHSFFPATVTEEKALSHFKVIANTRVHVRSNLNKNQACRVISSHIASLNLERNRKLKSGKTND